MGPSTVLGLLFALTGGKTGLAGGKTGLAGGKTALPGGLAAPFKGSPLSTSFRLLFPDIPFCFMVRFSAGVTLKVPEGGVSLGPFLRVLDLLLFNSYGIPAYAGFLPLFLAFCKRAARFAFR